MGKVHFKSYANTRRSSEPVWVSAHKQAEKLHSIIEEFKVPNAHLLTKAINNLFPKETILGQSTDQLDELAAHPEADLVVVAIVGSAGLRPTLAALKAGKDVVLANKESLVVGGKLVTDTTRESGARSILLIANTTRFINAYWVKKNESSIRSF